MKGIIGMTRFTRLELKIMNSPGRSTGYPSAPPTSWIVALSAAQPSLQWVPWASVPHLPGQIILPSGPRYYDPLRLPAALLRLLCYSLSSPDTLRASVASCVP
jgi:hypothetical protein